MGTKKWLRRKQEIEQAFGLQPADVHAQFTARTMFYKEDLLNRVKGMFEIKCPKEWDTDYMLDTLLLNGEICVTDTPLGILPLLCSPYGENVFRRPNKVEIANHEFPETLERTIGKDCVVIYLGGSGRSHYGGIIPILNIYAEQLASCDGAIDVNIINSKTAFVFGANDNREAESLKAMYDDISKGKPAVFMKRQDLNGITTDFFRIPVKENLVAHDLQMTKRTIIEEFLTRFGINNANTDKRERQIQAEVNSNNEELMVNTEYWQTNLDKYCKDVKNMFGIDVSIKLKYRGTQIQPFNN